jgi:ABC-type sugar transport system ATPase subunit
VRASEFTISPAMNFVPAGVRQKGVGLTAIDKDGFSVPLSGLTSPDQLASVTLGIRPEDVYVAHDDEPGMAARAIAVKRLGEATLAYLDLGNSKPFLANCRVTLQSLYRTPSDWRVLQKTCTFSTKAVREFAPKRHNSASSTLTRVRENKALMQ